MNDSQFKKVTDLVSKLTNGFETMLNEKDVEISRLKSSNANLVERLDHLGAAFYQIQKQVNALLPRNASGPVPTADANLQVDNIEIDALRGLYPGLISERHARLNTIKLSSYCSSCYTPVLIQVSQHQFNMLKIGTPLAEVFPDMPQHMRRQLATGVCSGCPPIKT